MINKRDRVSVGGASIILIMLVLALSGFALLAIRSSINEKRLAVKTSKSIKEYYEMDAEATELYSEICNAIKTNGLSAMSEKYPEKLQIEYLEDSAFLAKYTVSRGDRSIFVELSGDAEDVSIVRWSTKTAADEGLYEIQLTD